MEMISETSHKEFNMKNFLWFIYGLWRYLVPLHTFIMKICLLWKGSCGPSYQSHKLKRT